MTIDVSSLRLTFEHMPYLDILVCKGMTAVYKYTFCSDAD